MIRRSPFAASFTLCFALCALSTASWASSYKILKTLYPVDGVNPVGGLAFDAVGNLYGTASNGGGPFGADGSVFMLTPSPTEPWSERALYVFNPDGTEGLYPHWTPLLDNQGNVYGVTSEGGEHEGGTIFELSPSQQHYWNETNLYEFESANGWRPNQMLKDAAGNFFLTTEQGGIYGFDYDFGEAVEISPVEGGGYTEQVLHYFTTADNDGMSPRSNLVQDAAGNFYGTTKGGGLYDKGTVFQLAQSKLGGWHEAVIYSFNGHDGWWPEGALAIDDAGNIYGTTLYGGSHVGNDNPGIGNIFELSPSSDGTWTETVIHTFQPDSNDGSEPMGGVTVDSAGNLFGTTFQGGASFLGTVFEFSPAGSGQWAGKILHNFSGADGAAPYCQLIFDNSGNLYGTTSLGGINNAGVVFEITP
jgi:uncharacterized repeat protein (TIGR03803 family)